MQEVRELAKRQTREYFRLQKLSFATWKTNDYFDSCPTPAFPPSGAQATENTQLEAQIEEMKVMETYQILILPETTLRQYLSSMGSVGLRKEFRKLAMLVHPDKNNHPSAKIAFQKLYGAFVEVLQTFN